MLTRENKTTDERTAYQKMYAGLEAIANTYQINLGRGHFFEDMILKLGESKDPSSNSNFGDSKAKPGYTYFDF